MFDVNEYDQIVAKPIYLLLAALERTTGLRSLERSDFNVTIN